MTQQLSVGVIGHVDHGKTTLVKALTGTETDRLEEEKRRGLTIVLGFAYLQSEHGMIDLIDAPGHSDFVRTMISGATGMDAALLVVAASEGVMPQTIEHLRIAHYLGIDKVVVALTKTDLVTDEVQRQAEQGVRDLLASLDMQVQAIVPVAALEGRGVDTLVTALDGLFAHQSERDSEGGFYLPFDRVFTIQGFGTVVTGTLRGGVLRVDDEGMLAPNGVPVRVRGLEVHGQSVDQAFPGQRVAANIRTSADVERGLALAASGRMAEAEFWDARVTLGPEVSRPLKNGQPLRLLHGTTETQVAIRLLDRDRLGAGEEANVQFRLKEKAAAWPRDRFILRTVSPVETIGGGQFLNTQAKRHRRFDEDVMAQMAAADGQDGDAALAAHIAQAGMEGVLLVDLAAQFSISEEAALRAAQDQGCLETAGRIFDGGIVGDAAEKLSAALTAWHEEQPMRRGVGQQVLLDRARVPNVIGQVAVEALSEVGSIVRQDGLLRLTGHDPLEHLGDARRKYLDQLEARIKMAAMKPPSLEELVAENPKGKDLAELLIETGQLIPLHDFKKTNLFLFHRGVVDEAVEALRNAFPDGTGFRAGEARQVLDSTRKYMIPFLTWLDRQGITKRDEDLRQMVGRPGRVG
jgi:selenocysteine-specific elongation factor